MAKKDTGKQEKKKKAGRTGAPASTDKEFEIRRLYKSRDEKVIDGVCAGLGDYLGIDPVLVRVVWVLLVLFGGTGILAYIVAMILVPREPDGSGQKKAAVRRKTDSARLWGSILVVVGVSFLLNQLGVFPFGFGHLWRISWVFVWPLLLIAVGVYALAGGFRKSAAVPDEGRESAERKVFFVRNIRRLREERKIAGVCAGLGKQFGVDVTIIRVVWVVAAFATGGVAALLYLVMIVLLKEEESPTVAS